MEGTIHLHIKIKGTTIWRLISALNFIFTKNKILLLDPPPNENSDVSFAPHKTTENTTISLVITKTLT